MYKKENINLKRFIKKSESLRERERERERGGGGTTGNFRRRLINRLI